MARPEGTAKSLLRHIVKTVAMIVGIFVLGEFVLLGASLVSDSFTYWFYNEIPLWGTWILALVVGFLIYGIWQETANTKR